MARAMRAVTPGFSIFYMGINLGAFIAPLICGYLGQRVSWHAGFASAGIGMVIGVIQYVLGGRYLGEAGLRPATAGHPSALAAARRQALIWGLVIAAAVLIVGGGTYTGILPITATQIADGAGYLLLALCVGFFGWLFFGGDWTPEERNRLYVIGVFFLAAALFWSLFEQAGSTLNLFADRDTRTSIFGWSYPSSWFQSMNSLFVWAFAPVFAWLWLSLGRRGKEPSTPVKFALGLILVGAGFGDPDRRRQSRAERRAGQPDVADRRLPASHLRRTLPEPGRPQRDDEARPGAHRRPDDGRLVPREPRSATSSPAASPASTSRCRCRHCSPTSPCSASSPACSCCPSRVLSRRMMGEVN